MVFLEGISDEVLADGPGHFPGTALPGEPGNVAIAGHRTTHLAPFWALDVLARGDRIVLETRAGSFEYRVVWQRVVDPYAGWVVRRTERRSLTLSTCNPRFSAAERLVVRAVQVDASPS